MFISMLTIETTLLLMQTRTVGIKNCRRRCWSFLIISLLGVGLTTLGSECKDYCSDRDHYRYRTEAWDIMMGMTQEFLRDGYAPTGVQPLYSSDPEIFQDKLYARIRRSMHLPFVWCSATKLGLVKSLLCCFLWSVLPLDFPPIAPKRQLRREGGSGETPGIMLVKGNSAK